MIIGISGRIGSGKDTVGKIIQYLTLDKEVFAMTNADIVADLEYNGYCASKSNWQIKKFAGKLKDIVCILLGCTREQLEDSEFKNTELGEEWDTRFPTMNSMYGNGEIQKMTPRILLQRLGTEAGRQIIHENIWVNALFSDYKCPKCNSVPDQVCFGHRNPSWIITDMRFPNEVKAIKDRGGITIRVNRPLGKHNLIYKNNGIVDVNLSQHSSETALDNAEFDYVINNDSNIETLIEKVKEILIKENIL